MSKFNSMEMMICAAARLIDDGAMVVVGTGAPCAASMLAQKTTAPNLTLMFEAGGVGPLLPRRKAASRLRASHAWFRRLGALSAMLADPTAGTKVIDLNARIHHLAPRLHPLDTVEFVLVRHHRKESR